MKYERRARRLEHTHLIVGKMRVAAIAGRAYEGDPSALIEIERLAPDEQAFAQLMLGALKMSEDPFLPPSAYVDALAAGPGLDLGKEVTS